MFLDISDLSHFKKKTKSIYLLKTQKLVKEDSKIHRLRQAKIPLTLFFLLLKNYKVSTDWSHQSPISNFPFKWSLWKLQGQIWDRKERVLQGFKSQENFGLIWKEVSLHKRMKFSIKNFFSKCDQIWSHLLKKYLIENSIFCAVSSSQNTCFV